MKNLITSEAVCVGHPDKMCDIIADNILDAYLEKDFDSRVAIEVMVTKEKVIVSGEVSSHANINIERIIRNTICNIGYNNDDTCYNGNTIPIEIILNTQSSDISIGVNQKEIGAGDQGIMFGYATNETKEYMPITSVLVNNLAKRLEIVRKKKIIPYLLPDGKCQITYNQDLQKIDTIIVSNQHKNIDIKKMHKDIKEKVIEKAIPKKYLTNATKYLINPTGYFRIGGPLADTGLTGRKIVVDTYGGIIPHGGGAFSGKDYTKVDRTGAYYARYVAKNIVASGICQKLMITVSYAIGITNPISITANTFDNDKEKLELVYKIINKFFDFSLNNMINELKLKRPIYHQTTVYSHFGRSNLPYEKLNRINEIIDFINKL